ncbi:MAG: hypothetical protein GC184_06900 [Rhizobiales bacterium]|nr:hypothetical protein [Hyphomicrobiales bacterium]
MSEPVFARHVLMSPLHADVAAESRTNLWTQWNGYSVAALLSDRESEYQALRYAAALVDLSPTCIYAVTGAQALGFLQRLVTGDVSKLAPGARMPVFFCDDRGLLVGAGRLACRGDNDYHLSTDEPALAWLLDSAYGFDVRVEDMTQQQARIGVWGARAEALLALVTSDDLTGLQPDHAASCKLAGMPVSLVRNGADHLAPGYVLTCDLDDASAIWRRLRDQREVPGLQAIGWDVLNTARLEMGIARAGVDYQNIFSAIHRADALTPFEAGVGAHVDFTKTHFTGRAALLPLKDKTPARKIIRLQVNGQEPLTLSDVRQGDAVIGRVTSSAYSPAHGAHLALARVSMTAGKTPDSLSVEAEFRRNSVVSRAWRAASLPGDATIAINYL